MDFKSTYTVNSVSLPGVIVTLKRLGPRRRAEVELSISATRTKQRELSLRHEAVRKRLIASIDLDPKDAEGKPIEETLSSATLGISMELQELAEQIAALSRSEVHPEFLKAAVKAFGGTDPLTYEGKPATAELVCDVGPAELFDELVEAIDANAYMKPKEAENLSSATTSGVEVAGETMSSIAPIAKTADGTELEAV